MLKNIIDYNDIQKDKEIIYLKELLEKKDIQIKFLSVNYIIINIIQGKCGCDINNENIKNDNNYSSENPKIWCEKIENAEEIYIPLQKRYEYEIDLCLQELNKNQRIYNDFKNNINNINNKIEKYCEFNNVL